MYEEPIDREMMLLKLVNKSGPIGIINWYALHPTSMMYDNHLISGDHKGYASLMFENEENGNRAEDEKFVAAFAQSTPGDITPNLNLDNTGPSDDDFENTAYSGNRQLETARVLFKSATVPLIGEITSQQIYQYFSNYEVEDKYTKTGIQHTCTTAYGYSFAGGSTEDGGDTRYFAKA